MNTSNPVDRPSVDTNVLVYAHDVDAGDRHDRAIDLLTQLRSVAVVVLIAQVLNEFYWVMTRPKRPSPLTHEEATDIVRELAAACEIVPVSSAVTLRALGAMPTHGLSFWDALVWSAAREGNANVLYTEDFQHGRTIEGVQILNPFLP